MKKQEGQYMTPHWLTDFILNEIGYCNKNILSKRIMEPSFGDGAFLENIVNRIIRECLKQGKSPNEINSILKANVFGIEKDRILYNLAIKRLEELLNSYHMKPINWNNNLIHGDTLFIYKDYMGKMDFVVGNPPYVRIRNMSEQYRVKTKELRFSKGIQDLYIDFYEIGLAMLNHTGRLGYISPNSFLKNTSQREFRNYLIENKLLSAIYDFKTSKVFPDADPHVCICLIDKNRTRENHDITYKELNYNREMISEKIPYEYFKDSLINQPWNLGTRADIDFLEENKKYKVKIKDLATVQNGIETNKNKLYVIKAFTDKQLTRPYTQIHQDSKIVFFKDFNGTIRSIESGILHRCVKGSKYNGESISTYIIFPYEKIAESKRNKSTYIPFSEERLQSLYPMAYSYLLEHKAILLSRDIEKDAIWFQFGRSQGFKNSGYPKIVFKHMIQKEKPSIIPFLLTADVLVYSGRFITAKVYNETTEQTKNELDYMKKTSEIMRILQSDEFARYCSLAGKDKSGGFVEISAKMIQEYGISNNEIHEKTDNSLYLVQSQ